MIKKKDKLYVRVSTQYDSQKDSPEHQESFIREVASREGTKFGAYDVYLDRDTATTIIDREDVKRMVEDAMRGEVRSVWFASLSRFSRDALDAISLKRILVNALKVRLVSIEDGYDSAVKDDELLFGVKSFVNQSQSEQIGISSSRGIRQSALEFGNFIGTIPPYGYKKISVNDPRQKSGKRKSLEAVEEQALIVQKIFELYIDQGYGDKMIVNYLNGDNPQQIQYQSYTGGLWSITAVQSILENPIYTGYNVYGRYKAEVAYDDLTDLMKRRKKLVKQSPDKWEWSEKIWYPVIIPLDRWRLAQEIRMKRGGGKRGGRRSFVNVFAKMMFCAECGSAIVTMGGKQIEKYRYLMCSRRRRQGERGCSNGKWLPYYRVRDELISEIIRRIREQLDTEVDIARFSDAKKIDGKMKKRIEKKIYDNRKLLFEIRRLNLLGEIDDAQYEYEKEQYEEEIAEAEKKLKIIKTEERRMIDVEKIKKEVADAMKRLGSLSSYANVEEVRPLLMTCVKRIEVAKDGRIDIQIVLG